MATGDSLQTSAIIAKSSHMFTERDRKLYLINTDNISLELDQVKNYISQTRAESNIKNVLFISGRVISYISKNPTYANTLVFEILESCGSVICFRASPIEKAEAVRMIRTYTKKTVLAIGDGPNDANMILAANVGVGILGNEGTRAAHASDYTIMEFYHLWKLMFVHGRWSYIRSAELILYFYFKSFLLTFP